MPAMKVTPRTLLMQQELLTRYAAGPRKADTPLIGILRKKLKAAIRSIKPEIPESDILVDLEACPLDPDPAGAALHIYADTCPGELEIFTGAVCRAVNEVLIELMLTEFGVEFWLRFLPGGWYLVKNGVLVESVPHPSADDAYDTK